MKSLLHGISACYSNCESILKNKYALIINNVFTKKEIDAIEYLYERCGEIQEQDVICEIGENIRMMIQEAYDYIGEIRIKLDQIIVIRNDRIENWKSLIG